MKCPPPLTNPLVNMYPPVTEAVLYSCIFQKFKMDQTETKPDDNSATLRESDTRSGQQLEAPRRTRSTQRDRVVKQKVRFLMSYIVLVLVRSVH